jgi:valyl-tRNA synthetase
MVTAIPVSEKYNEQLINDFELVKEVVTSVRNIRQEKQLPTKDPLVMQILSEENTLAFGEVMKKLSNLSAIETVTAKPEGAASFIVKSSEYHILLEGKIDVEEEIKKVETELQYTQGFLDSVMKKLSNEKFVSGAPPQVVQNEMNKKADAEAKIKALEERLKGLKG